MVVLQHLWECNSVGKGVGAVNKGKRNCGMGRVEVVVGSVYSCCKDSFSIIRGKSHTLPILLKFEELFNREETCIFSYKNSQLQKMMMHKGEE